MTRSRTIPDRKQETREEKGNEEDREKDRGREGKRVVIRENKEKKIEEGKGTQTDEEKKDSGREGMREGYSRKRLRGTYLLWNIAIAEGIQKLQGVQWGTLIAGKDHRVFCSGEGNRIQWSLNLVKRRGKRSAYPSWEHLTS